MHVVIPEDEDVEHCQVERKTQCELCNHHRGEDLICDITRGFAVVNGKIRTHVCLAKYSSAASTVGEVTHPRVLSCAESSRQDEGSSCFQAGAAKLNPCFLEGGWEVVVATSDPEPPLLSD